eukprot:TRINITY_DN3384_c0_g1_i1.p1 TRINITY_DN3384_c0_g1~~TRINITY_DN3384_c0_g1_i1.p1  ORF type:complete len:321 (-),score=176.88 TRINITY_DN3384_c0_g1_i1:40-1002(-)
MDAALAGEMSDEDEATDGEEDEEEAPIVKRGRRGAICCEPVDEDDEGEVRKKVPKSPEAQQRLEDALRANIMFAHLDVDERSQVFDAMFQVVHEAGSTIIKQGDDGDNFYVIDSGKCDIYVAKGDEPPKLVLSLEAGGSFGELALIYGSPRAATVKAATATSLWAIDRITYRRILMGTTMRKRKLYEGFLEKVPILQHLTKYERITVADALESFHFVDGEVIVRQGEPGDKFYIIVSGEVRCDQTSQGDTKEVARLGPAAYFGEIALLTDRPRAATVVAVGDVKCVGLDRDRFNRVLGPCEDILRRNMDQFYRFASLMID